MMRTLVVEGSGPMVENGPGPYILMHREHPVCKVLYDPSVGRILEVLETCDVSRCPLSALDGSRIDARYFGYWWESRFVPSGRLPRYLQQRPMFARLFAESRGMCLSDHYWMKAEEDSGVSWASANFFENPFDEAVGRELLGTCSRSAPHPGESMDSPSFWSNGMLRKYWRIAADGTRQLCKSSSHSRAREALNEYVVSSLMKTLLNQDAFVAYALEEGAGGLWSVCDCFTDAVLEFVPMTNILYGDTLGYGEEAYRDIVRFGREHGVPDVVEALDRMMFVDCLIGNTDRHFGNFGFLRNSETLQFEAVAPIFDCGTSLWCDFEGGLFAPFAENLNYQADLIDDYSWVDWEAVHAAPALVAEALVAGGVDGCEAALVSDHVEAQVRVLEDAAG